MDPTALPSGNIRLATVRDVPRIAIVATAGFFYSSTFPWEKRYHHQYPEDTPKSYAKRIAELIRDPKGILLVVEDSYQPDENSKTGATIVPSLDDKEYQSGERVIVGFAAWTLPPGSKHLGQFTDQEDLSATNRPEFDGGPGRDKDMALSKALWSLGSKEVAK